MQQCHLVGNNSIELDTHPTGLSGSMPSSHLKVTFLFDKAGVAEDPWEIRPLWNPACSTLIKWLSSSSSRARNEHDTGGDWIGVALQNKGRVNIHCILQLYRRGQINYIHHKIKIRYRTFLSINIT